MLFYKDYIVFHVLDRCTGFHAGQEANDSSAGAKSEDVLIDLYSTTWVTHHGPFETLYVDGESGLTNPNAKARLQRLGTKVQVRAPEQNARFLERRGRALRLCLPEAEDQCGRESLSINLKSLLAECVCISKALTFVDEVSPYPCAYVRTPTLLQNFAMTADEPNGTQQQCIRTISIDAMMDYNPDDMVDEWRRASSKDISSWRGTPGQPADVVISSTAVMLANKFEDLGMINASNSHEATKAIGDHFSKI